MTDLFDDKYAYPNNPQIVTYARKQLTFFILPWRLNKLDLCDFFNTIIV